MSTSLSRALTVREGEVVRLLWRLRFLTGAQLAEFLFGGTPLSPSSQPVVTRRQVRSLRRAGLLTSTPRMVGGALGGELPPAYYLTPAGQRLGASLSSGAAPHRLRSTGTVLVRHALATADVLLSFRRAAETQAEHELVRWECDREAAIPIGRSLLVPDGYLVYRVGVRHLHAFLEIDLGTENVRAIEEKLGRYQDLYRGDAWRDRHPIWPFTLVVAETAVRGARLRAIAAVVFGSSAPRWSGLASSFHFGTLSDVTGPNGPLGPIWERLGGSGRVPLAPEPLAAAGTRSAPANTAMAPRAGEAAP